MFTNEKFEDTYGKYVYKKGSNIKQWTTLEDMDIYKQILKDWEDYIEKKLGIKFTYDFNKNYFIEEWSDSKKNIQYEEKLKIKEQYFSKRLELLNIIFNPTVVKKIKKINIDLKNTEDYEKIVKKYLKNKTIIKNINFENNDLELYKDILNKIKKIKIILLEFNFIVKNNIEISFERLTTIDEGGLTQFKNTSANYGKDQNKTWAEILTEISEEIINYEKQLFNLYQFKTKYDVPPDNNCLFWSIATSYLLESINSEDEFKKRFIQLFGEEELQYLFFTRNAFQNYEIKQPNNLNQIWFKSEISIKLVTEIFRNRVVSFISNNRQLFEFDIQQEGYNFEDYLRHIRKTTSWGGGIEIQAISHMINSQILVGDIKIRDDNENLQNLVKIFHVNNNYYNFDLSEIDKRQISSTKIKNKRKINNSNGSFSFSIDSILKEKPISKKLKVENKNIKFLNFQGPIIKDNMSYSSIDTTVSLIKNNNIIWEENQRQQANYSNMSYSSIDTGMFSNLCNLQK